MGATHHRSRVAFRNPVRCERLHGRARRHDDAHQIRWLIRGRQLELGAMRIHAAGQITPAFRSQCDGMRVERADGSNAHRQSERHHPMREHGSRRQQSGLCWLTLLSGAADHLAFRNPV